MMFALNSLTMAKAIAKMKMNVMVDRADAELRPLFNCSTTRMEMVVVPLAPPVRIFGRSYIRRTAEVRKMTATASAGFTRGTVILVNRCQALAPSIFAASYVSALMPCSPARISRAMNGVVFHTSAITTADRAGHKEEVHW